MADPQCSFTLNNGHDNSDSENQGQIKNDIDDKDAARDSEERRETERSGAESDGDAIEADTSTKDRGNEAGQHGEIEVGVGQGEGGPEDAERKELEGVTTREAEGVATMGPERVTTREAEGVTTREPERVTTREAEGVTTREAEGVTTREAEGVTTREAEGVTTREAEGVTTKGPEGAKKELRVPDGGWGWMVALGAFVCCVLLISQGLCFGILFSQYLLAEGVSSTTTGWIYNIQLMVWHFMMILVRPLSKEFGMRGVGFFGTTIGATAMILSAFTPSPGFLYFSISIMSGIGAGLVVSISYITVAPFFDKRRGLANTLLVAGSPMGQFAMAPLIRYLLEQYSFRGAALIYGGLVMHAYIGVAMFQPFKWHLKPAQEDPGETQQKLLPQDDGSPRPHVLDQHFTQSINTQQDSECVRAAPGNVKRRLRGPSEGSNISIASADFSIGVAASSVVSSLHVDRSSAVSSEAGGIITRLCSTFVRIGRTTISDMSLFGSLRVCIIAISFSLSSTSFLNFVMLAPFSMQASGHSLQDAAWCISMMGIANLLTRFIVSPLSDWHKFNIRICLMLGYFLKAVAILGFSFSGHLVYLVMWAVLFGVGLGATISLQTLVIVAYMGIDLLPPTFGNTGIATAVTFPVLGPVIGVVRDATDSFLPSLWMIAAMDFASSVLWIFMPAAVTLDSARAHRREAQMEQAP